MESFIILSTDVPLIQLKLIHVLGIVYLQGLNCNQHSTSNLLNTVRFKSFFTNIHRKFPSKIGIVNNTPQNHS